MPRFDARAFLKGCGAEFKRARLARGLSRERLAELAGVHPNTVGVAERGDRDLSGINETRILLALGCERLVIEPRRVLVVLGASPPPAAFEALRSLPDPVIALHIGNAIRERRASLGLSLEEASAAAFLHRNTLWNIERGLVVAGGLSLYRAYLALGVRALVPFADRLELE
jgi:transcriptional regulator with XRE-family HTH domain